MLFASAVDISDLSAEQINGVIASTVAIGALYCFLGYRTLRFVLGLTGFLIAGGVAATLANWISEGNQIAIMIALLVGGVCGALALYFIYKAGVFLMGLLGAAVIAHNLLEGRPESWMPLAVLGLAVVGGLIALLIERPVLILATASLGSWIVVSGIAFFITGPGEIEELREVFRLEEHRAIMLASWAVVAFAGLLSQTAITKKKEKPEKG